MFNKSVVFVKKFASKLFLVASLAVACATSAMAADPVLDYTAVGTSITGQITPAITAAMPILGVILGITIGLKIYKKFAK